MALFLIISVDIKLQSEYKRCVIGWDFYIFIYFSFHKFFHEFLVILLIHLPIAFFVLFLFVFVCLFVCSLFRIYILHFMLRINISLSSFILDTHLMSFLDSIISFKFYSFSSSSCCLRLGRGWFVHYFHLNSWKVVFRCRIVLSPATVSYVDALYFLLISRYFFYSEFTLWVDLFGHVLSG